MATKKQKRTQTIRISITPDIETLLKGLTKEFRGLDYPELFKLSLSSFYRHRVEEGSVRPTPTKKRKGPTPSPRKPTLRRRIA